MFRISSRIVVLLPNVAMFRCTCFWAKKKWARKNNFLVNYWNSAVIKLQWNETNKQITDKQNKTKNQTKNKNKTKRKKNKKNPMPHFQQSSKLSQKYNYCFQAAWQVDVIVNANLSSTSSTIHYKKVNRIILLSIGY
jgi:hypothetical protein